MKTTIDLPDELIQEAMKITSSKSKIETIKLALNNLIRQEKRKKIFKYRGKLDLNLDLDSLRGRKNVFS